MPEQPHHISVPISALIGPETICYSLGISQIYVGIDANKRKYCALQVLFLKYFELCIKFSLTHHQLGSAIVARVVFWHIEVVFRSKNKENVSSSSVYSRVKMEDTQISPLIGTETIGCLLGIFAQYRMVIIDKSMCCFCDLSLFHILEESQSKPGNSVHMLPRMYGILKSTVCKNA